MLNIALLALPNVIPSSLFGPLDIFTVANRQWLADHPQSEPPFATAIVQIGDRPVSAFTGLVIPQADTATALKSFDIVIVPAIYGDIEPALGDTGTIQWLRAQRETGARICTVCAGTFLAAEAGLLAGRRATTHWALAELFRSRYPHVELHEELLLIDEDEVISAGGVTAYLDLCLHLLRRFCSAELATAIARLFLLDTSRTTQLPYATCSFPTGHGDQEIFRVQQWLATSFSRPLTVSHLARQAGLGERTFSRRFRRATGTSPNRYLQQLRIEAARSYLEKTREPVAAISALAGYEDVTAFRRLFRKMTGLSPSAYRKRFSIL